MRVVRACSVAAAAVVLAGLSAGCATALAEPAAGHAAAARPVATRSAATPLLTEARRELAAMRTSRYRHRTHVDEQDGVYDYDCSGLLDYALGRAVPAALAALPTSTSDRPLAADVERHLRAAGGGDPWHAVATVADLAPGDVVAWLATADSDTDDTGHVMIVNGAPVADPAHPGRWLVPVIDSTVSPHARDSRDDGDTGLGTGTIGLAVDAGGRPVAFAWRGGISTRWRTTEIALGRPT